MVILFEWNKYMHEEYHLNKTLNKSYGRLKTEREYLHVVNTPQTSKLHMQDTGIKKYQKYSE